MGQVLAEQEEEVAEEEDVGRCFEVRAVEVDWGLLEAEARKRHSVESHWLKGQEFGRKTLSRQKVGRSSWPDWTHGGHWSGEPQKRFQPLLLQMWLHRTGGSPTFGCPCLAWQGSPWQKLDLFPLFSASLSDLRWSPGGAASCALGKA